MNHSTDLAPVTYPPAILALGVFIAAAALVLMGVQPILVGFYSDHLQLNLSQNGWVLAAEQLGGAAGALFGYWIATRMRWTYSIVGACVLAAGINIATPYAADVGQLIATRFISGLTSTIAYTVAIYFLAHSSKPDRTFGLLMILQTAFFSIDAMILPLINAHYGYIIAVGSAAAWFAAAALAAFWLPPGPEGAGPSAAVRTDGETARPLVGATALLGAFLLQLSIFAVWGFLERVGRGNGLSDVQIGYGLGIGVLGGIPGGLFPALAGKRFGRLSMIALSTIILVASYVALDRALNRATYTLWITILNVGWVLGLTYYMALTVAHDSDGRLTRLMPFSQILSAAAGPACSALAISGERLTPIFVVASGSATLGLVATCAASSLATRLDNIRRDRERCESGGA